MSLAETTPSTQPDNVRVLIGSDMFGYTLYCGGNRIYVYREALPALIEQLVCFLTTGPVDPALASRIVEHLAFYLPNQPVEVPTLARAAGE